MLRKTLFKEDLALEFLKNLSSWITKFLNHIVHEKTNFSVNKIWRYWVLEGLRPGRTGSRWTKFWRYFFWKDLVLERLSSGHTLSWKHKVLERLRSGHTLFWKHKFLETQDSWNLKFLIQLVLARLQTLNYSKSDFKKYLVKKNLAL